MHEIVLYTRAGCCLCDDARELLRRLREKHPSLFVIEERDIEADDALHRAYLERIPVVAIDGEDAFELVVAEPELKRRLGIVQAG
jgi:glutaredoxin